jgi:plasmid stabilization system protein ParE
LKLIISPRAAADIERLHTFLANTNPEVAGRFAQSLGSAIESLEELPNRGRPTAVVGLRELIVPFGHAAYVLRYAYNATRDELVVIRIWHGREARE